MKIICFCSVLLLLMIILAPVRANDTITITPSGDGTWDFSHELYYIWKIEGTVPDGERIDYAEISFSEIYNSESWEKNALFAQLLSPDAISGLDFDSDGLYVGSDDSALIDNSLASYGGVELFRYTDFDGPLSTDDLTYSLNDQQLALLNSYIQPDGSLEFGLGFDPDCRFFFRHFRGFRFHESEPSPQVIPAPGAIFLGGIGVCLVGWLRRRKTL